MKKVFLRIAISTLLCTSMSACGLPSPAFPTRYPAPPSASQTATIPPSSSPTLTATIPATETPAAHPGWTTYPDIRSIRDMVFDYEGNLWAVGPGGVAQLRPDGTLRRFAKEDGLLSNDLLSVGLDTEGAVWVGSRDSGAARTDGKGWQTFSTAS